jgi:NitT/TauT family transport system substrate-binding protein
MSACGSGSTEESTGSTKVNKGPTSVKVVVGTTSTTFATHYVADQLGLFRKAGLKVQTIDGGGQGQDAVALAQRGRVDIAFTGAGVPVNAISQGLDLKLLTFDLGIGASSVIARKDLYDSGEIKGIADLAGRRIGTHQPGAVNYLLALNLATVNKIEYGRNMFTTQTTDTLIQALKSKQVDAIVTAGYALQATKGFGEPIFVPGAEAMQHEFGIEYIPGMAAVWATSNYIEKNSKTVGEYVKAMSQAQQWIRDHTVEETAEQIAAHPAFAGKLDAAAITAQLAASAVRELMNADGGSITAETWTRMVDFLKAGGTLNEDRLSFAKAVDLRFIP